MKLSIKNWEEADRPREKLMEKGRAMLTDSELLAILMGSGNREETAVELAKHILSSVDNNLNSLYKLSVADLMKFKGIGEAKSITIIAAMELGDRQKGAEVRKRNKIKSSKDVYDFFMPSLAHAPYEELWCLYLNRKNEIIGKQQVGTGGVSGVAADPKRIFIRALELIASSIILCHNHPSGSLDISVEDKSLTKKVKGAGDFLDIKLLDHIIIAGNKYISFADDGIINDL
ncbi:MAG: DNA repair protein RadC [Bacteroidales bacterium]|nr:DNA repair protein RadC [Bacteroidales bacterium]